MKSFFKKSPPHTSGGRDYALAPLGNAEWSTCKQTILRLQISLTEIFSNSICHRVTENYNKSAAWNILAIFGTL